MSDRAVFDAFFTPKSQMQVTLAILCDSHATTPQDPVTHTVLTMLTSPMQIQLTALGWQPFKGKELTFPFQRMTHDQKNVIKTLLTDEGVQAQWRIHEHALVFRPKAVQRPAEAPCLHLPPLDVLEAMCATILHTNTYPDRRLRVAVCNILLQRVQASVPVEKKTLTVLNQNLFGPAAPPA